MTLLDCVGIGINGIIGTGIFLLPARVFRDAGALSWAAWLAIGAVCLLVGLCFCETSGRSERNGGPYLYARDAFGRWVGVGVGWMALASNFFAYGAVARAFGRNLSFLVPPLNRAGPQIALAIAVIGGLAALNYRGIRPGALTSDVFSGAKLIPILLFVGLGLLFVDWHRLALPAPAGKSTVEALKLGGFAALFACTGFEYVPAAAGETENPRRNVPLALIFALLGSMLLYVLVQIAFMGTHPDPGAASEEGSEPIPPAVGPDDPRPGDARMHPLPQRDQARRRRLLRRHPGRRARPSRRLARVRTAPGPGDRIVGPRRRDPARRCVGRSEPFPAAPRERERRPPRRRGSAAAD